MMKRLFLIIAVGLSIVGCKDRADTDKADMERPVVQGIKVIEIHPSRIDEYYETSGTVKAKTISPVASRVMGTVTSIKVREGDKVSEGDLLLTIDDRDLLQRVRAAQEAYRESLKALEAAKQNKSLLGITQSRYRGLYDEMAISKQEMDEIETRKKIADIEYERAEAMAKGAEAALLEAQVNYGFTRIKSPVSGIVTEKRIEVGSMAVPGIPLLTVEDDSSFKLEVNVDESLSEKLEIGLPVNVTIDSIGKEITGHVYEIVPSVDPVSRTFLVKIDVKGESLRTGLYGRVLIPKGHRETLLIPRAAIVERGQLVGVYAVDDKGIITYRLIRTGKTYNESIEILSGLKDGDRIVADGIENVIDGGIVKRQ
jgi:RND family efflux transporter MFP subunit